jgi:hypothetical protein
MSRGPALMSGPGGAVDPLVALFSGGITGGYWDFTDASTLYSDTSRTTLASSDGTTVNGVTDLSGNGYHLTSTNGTGTVTKQTGYASFTTAALVAAFGDKQVGSTSGWTCVAATRATLVAGQFKTVVGADRNTGRIAQALNYVESAGAPYTLYFNGGTPSVNTPTFIASGVDSAIASQATTTGGYVWGHDGTTEDDDSVASVGTPASSSGGFLAVGGDWLGTTSYSAARRFSGRMYAVLFINRVLDSTEFDLAKSLIAAKAGITV